MTTTEACVIHGQRDLRVEAVDLPAPGAGEVLVDIGAGGICGSDLHYYLDGGFGTVRVREPMVLGHEVAGTIAALGAGVAGLKPGDRVAVNPSHPCGTCEYCARDEPQHCLEMRFWGSAMRMPHVQGGFRRRLVVAARQCVPVGDVVSIGEAAMSEPLAVALHAVGQAGEVRGKRALVTGFGPIGGVVLLAFKHAGAAEVTVTDVVDEPLAFARRLGASAAVNVAAERDALAAEEKDKGRFDLAVECSGNPRALAQAIACVRPRGTIVQVGIGGAFDVPMNLVVAKELRLAGSFRFHPEFERAAGLIARREIDVRPLITATRPLADAQAAFDLAADRRASMKVQIAFGL
ncbi:L-idonate 5-dehydrogenase [Neoroseomonas oryzicola]|uniref:L-idonate 5-dehydrogenase n=1 Tax=Neoroseomonas oryzicola TaxID=535904 RepID=A0A9X9WBI3_9PROT|nr:L-idonate 5-dehydrogenase [Neoroseomonas oryzicola]MBR0657693.1 L-idonate 5-dehydrogenase [Neoroseomonas oryzicola]NKE18949.1 L-idonate 5-dehydrogenase [Neoroseomonas oryzicola]